MPFSTLDAKIMYECAKRLDLNHVVKGPSQTHNVIELVSHTANPAGLCVETMRGYVVDEPSPVFQSWISPIGETILFTKEYAGFIQTATYHAFCFKRTSDHQTQCAGVYVCKFGLQKSMVIKLYASHLHDGLAYNLFDTLTPIHANCQTLKMDARLSEFLKTYK
jgi:hypothetical protein